MRGALLILKKEFLELSKDRKTLFFVFVLPFLLYPGIFGMMGKMARRDEAQHKNNPSRVYVSDPTGLLMPTLAANPKAFNLVPRPEGDLTQALRDQKLDLAVEVAPSAATAFAKQETFSLVATLDESERASEVALKRLKETLAKQEKAWVATRLKGLGASAQLAEPVKLETRDAADTKLKAGKLLGSILPYMLMVMMYSGSMQHGIYATAGEKERQTLLSLLATRLPRNQIIIGKLLYIFSIGVIAALLNLLSMAVSVATVGGGGGNALQAVAAVANPLTLLLTFMIMVPLGLFFSNYILLMGIQAKNSVEAGSAIMPGILLVVFLGVFTMAPGVDKMPGLTYVPVVNVCLALRKLFSQQGTWTEYLIAFSMTVALAAAMTALSTRLLNREKALFKA